MCTSSGESSWRGLPRSPSHESVTTDLSLFSVSSAASDAKLLRLLACKAGQGSDASQRGPSPNPDCKSQKRGSTAASLLSAASAGSGDACRELLAGCAALCAALGLHRSFSAGDVCGDSAAPDAPGAALRSACSELNLSAALEARALGAASRSCSTWVAVGGSQLPSPQRGAPAPPLAPADILRTVNKKVRQNYIRRRLLTTYRALERLSQSEFNLDRLELLGQAAAACAAAGGPGPVTLAVPARPPAPPAAPPAAPAPASHFCRSLLAGGATLALTAADLERERGRPLSKYERNMMIFNWLHTLDEDASHL